MEHEVLRLAGSLAARHQDDAAESARTAVLAWLAERGRELPPEALSQRDFIVDFAGRSCQAIRFQVDHVDAWAVRSEDADASVPGRSWVNEVVVAPESSKRCLFGVRQYVHTNETSLVATPASPRFVRDWCSSLLMDCGAQRVRAVPKVCADEASTSGLLADLTHPHRALPVIVLTLPEDAPRCLLNENQLAASLVGLAEVVILHAEQTWMLTERLGKLRSVFGGAVRCYFPGFAEDSNPYGHPLYLAEQLQTGQARSVTVDEIRREVARFSVFRLRRGREVLSFADIRSASAAARQVELERRAAHNKHLAEAVKRISELRTENEFLLQQQEYLLDEAISYQERADAAEARAGNLWQRLQVLRSPSDEAHMQDEPEPATWMDIAQHFDRSMSERLMVAQHARRQLRSNPLFEDVGLAWRCLLWLEHECHQKHLDGNGASLKDFALESGVRNSPCGGDAFEFDYQGRRLRADWHIKSGGNTRSPERCLRIYYTWDRQREAIIVAEMPAHRRTGAS